MFQLRMDANTRESRQGSSLGSFRMTLHRAWALDLFSVHIYRIVSAFANCRNSPFCLVIGLVEPHVPWVMGNASQYAVDGIKLPPHLADTPNPRHRTLLFDAWMKEQGDEGQPTEMKALERMLRESK